MSRNKLPPEEAQGVIGTAIKGLLTTLPNIYFNGTKSINFRNEQQVVNGLLEMAIESHETFEKAVEHQKENCAEWMKEIWDNCSTTVSGAYEKFKGCSTAETKDLQKEYIKAIKNMQQEMSDSMMRSCSLSSAIIVIQETVRLILIWKHISDAENCIIDNRQEIEDKLNQIRQDIQFMVKLQQDYLEISDYATRQEMLDDAEEAILKTSELINETRNLIADVKVTINGKKERLISDDQQMTVSLVGGVVQFAVNVGQFVSSSESATVAWVWVAGSILAAHVGIIGFTVYTKIVTKEVIQECRDAYRELLRLDTEVRRFQLQSSEFRRWLRGANRKLAE